MTRSTLLHRLVPSCLAILATAAALMLPAGRGRGQVEAEPTLRDVSVTCLRAEPGGNGVDPQLAVVAGSLRKVLPGHSFRVLGARGDRLAKGGLLRCELDDERTVTVQVLDPLDDDGKVALRVRLVREGRKRPVFVTDVKTPPNQLVFLDKQLPGEDARLLIGVAAR